MKTPAKSWPWGTWQTCACALCSPNQALNPWPWPAPPTWPGSTWHPTKPWPWPPCTCASPAQLPPCSHKRTAPI